LVYFKEVDIKIVVVVNDDMFLWISPHFELKSSVCKLHKQARKRCMSKELFLDKKRARQKFSFTHIRCLWISIDLSTGTIARIDDFWAMLIVSSRFL
jgi:hypothetical protein